jgi:hypothetical protein
MNCSVRRASVFSQSSCTRVAVRNSSTNADGISDQSMASANARNILATYETVRSLVYLIRIATFTGGPEMPQTTENDAIVHECKALLADFRHRALRHHAEGIFLCAKIFGIAITNSDGKLLLSPTRAGCNLCRSLRQSAALPWQSNLVSALPSRRRGITTFSY